MHSGTPATPGERWATTAIFLCNGVGIGGWAASIPTLKARLLLSDGALSLALLAFAAGAVIAMPGSGLLAARHGAWRMTRGAMLAFAAALLLPGLATNLAGLVAASCVLGAANGILDVAMNAHAGTVERRWRMAIMSSFHAAFSAGGLAGAALGGLLAPHGGGLVLIAAACVVLATAVLTWRKLQGDTPAAGPPARLMLPGRAALPLCAAAALCMLCEGAMADWSAVYLATIAGAGTGMAASGYAAFSAAMLGGRLVGDRIVRAIGHGRIVALGGLLAAAGVALAVLWAGPLPAAIGFALVGLGLSNVVPAIFSAAGRLGTSPATGLAMVATTGYAGFLTGPVVIGATAAAIGLRPAMALLIACAGLVAVLAGAVRPTS